MEKKICILLLTRRYNDFSNFITNHHINLFTQILIPDLSKRCKFRVIRASFITVKINQNFNDLEKIGSTLDGGWFFIFVLLLLRNFNSFTLIWRSHAPYSCFVCRLQQRGTDNFILFNLLIYAKICPTRFVENAFKEWNTSAIDIMFGTYMVQLGGPNSNLNKEYCLGAVHTYIMRKDEGASFVKNVWEGWNPRG